MVRVAMTFGRTFLWRGFFGHLSIGRAGSGLDPESSGLPTIPALFKISSFTEYRTRSLNQSHDIEMKKKKVKHK